MTKQRKELVYTDKMDKQALLELVSHSLELNDTDNNNNK